MELFVLSFEYDAELAVALAVVLGGCCVFQFWAREGRAARRAPPRDQLVSEGLLADGRLTIR